MHNTIKGKIGESLATSKFLEKGFEVFTTVEDNNYTDMIVSPPSKSDAKLEKDLYRIQVKTSFTERNIFDVKKTPKTKVDYYFLLNLKNQSFWIVPEAVVRDDIAKRKLRGNRPDATISIPKGGWKEYDKFTNLIKELNLDPSPIPRSDGQIGKIGEKLAVAKFLGEGYDVYEIIADIKGVDLVVGKDRGFSDVQVKYSPKNYQYRNIKEKDHPNYWYLLIHGDPEEYFFIPSVKMKEMVKSGSVSLKEDQRKNYRWS